MEYFHTFEPGAGQAVSISPAPLKEAAAFDAWVAAKVHNRDAAFSMRSFAFTAARDKKGGADD